MKTNSAVADTEVNICPSTTSKQLLRQQGIFVHHQEKETSCVVHDEVDTSCPLHDKSRDKCLLGRDHHISVKQSSLAFSIHVSNFLSSNDKAPFRDGDENDHPRVAHAPHEARLYDYFRPFGIPLFCRFTLRVFVRVAVKPNLSVLIMFVSFSLFLSLNRMFPCPRCPHRHGKTADPPN